MSDCLIEIDRRIHADDPLKSENVARPPAPGSAYDGCPDQDRYDHAVPAEPRDSAGQLHVDLAGNRAQDITLATLEDNDDDLTVPFDKMKKGPALTCRETNAAALQP